MRKNQSNTRPVFLHGMWRSGSTYVWSRFRAADNTYCYYEPLNHGLGRLTKERIGRDTPELASANAHPVLSRPYFAEYEPLLQRRGVKCFAPRFSYSRFALGVSASDEKLRRYLSSLTAYAYAQDKTPVLGFNASDLRIGWMNRHFDPVAIHISRDPLAIWRSYQKFAAQGNYTFFAAWMNVIEKNSKHPVFSPLVGSLILRRGINRIIRKPKSYYRDALKNMTAEESYAIVFYLWLTSTLHALSHCSHFIDMDRAGENDYAGNLSKSLGNACGFKITFDDLKMTEKNAAEFNNAEIELNIIKNFSVANALFDQNAIVKNLENFSQRKRDLINKAIGRVDGGHDRD